MQCNRFVFLLLLGGKVVVIALSLSLFLMIRWLKQLLR